ncbi:MAG TPA: pilus assembly protein PilP [Polyangiaceae bacterium]|nr:pilus assembly protein PilP [Polyangiaceae bacterium]
MKRPAGIAFAVLGFCAACVSATACEDKVVRGVDVPTPPANAAALASAAAAKPIPTVTIDESEFTESDRSRDPFRSYARTFVVQPTHGPVHQTNVVSPEYSIDELKLVGIVTRIQPAKAMLVDPKGQGHVVQRGQFVGKADVVQTAGRAGSTYEINWRVDRIREGDVVLVRVDPANPDVPSVTRVIPLRTEPTTDLGAAASVRN